METTKLKLIEEVKKDGLLYNQLLGEYHDMIFSLPTDISYKCAMITKLHELLYQHAKYWMEHNSFITEKH